MAKDSYWFPHDSNASSDPKMVALVSVYGMAGKGQYWTIIELLREQEGYRYSIAKKFSIASLADVLKMTLSNCEKFIDDLVNHFELLQRDDSSIWSNSLMRRMEAWDAKKKRLSERGKAGAEVTNAKKAAQAKINSAQAEDKFGTSEGQADNETGNYRENIKEQNKTEQDKEGISAASQQQNDNVIDFKKMKLADFLSSLKPFCAEFGRDTVRDFSWYWRESDDKGRMRFQLNRTWDPRGRLRTWKKNEGSNPFPTRPGGQHRAVITGEAVDSGTF